MTLEERRALKEKSLPTVDGIHHASAYIDWGWNGCGFGQLSFSTDRKTGEITCMNECMSRDSVRKILHSLADYIADRAVLLDNPEDTPPISVEEERKRQDEEYKKYLEEKPLNGRRFFRPQNQE